MSCRGLPWGSCLEGGATSSLPRRDVFVGTGKSLPIITWSPKTVVAATPHHSRQWDRGMPSPGKGEDGGTQLGVMLVFAVL